MSLRNKILVSIIVIMTLIVALLTTNLAYDALARSQAERQRAADLMARLAQEWITDLVTTTGVPKDFNDPEWRLRVGNKFGQSSLFRRWVMVDPQYKVIAWNMPGDPQEEFKTDDLKSAVEQGRIVVRENTIAAPLLLPDGRMICLRMNTEHLNPPPVGLVDRWQNVFIVMALGTVLLIVTVYMLLSRLVVRPLEVLHEASKRIADKDYSRTVPVPDNYDEISELISTFNKMTYSLQQHHEELQQKIDDEADRRRGTERRLVVAQRLSATGALAAGIAHEINNPLGGMLNAVNTLKRSELEPAKKQQYLEIVSEGLGRIQETVKKVLQFAPRKVNPKPVDVTEVIQKSLALVKHRLEKKGVTVETHFPADVKLVFGDESELQQVFLNLIINSIDAVPEKSGRLDFSCLAAEESKPGDVTFVVKDNGSGMTDEQVAHAFELFFTTKDVGEGTGLGLSIVHNIITNHGGRVEIDSKKGLGTMIKVTLPVHKPVDTPAK